MITTMLSRRAALRTIGLGGLSLAAGIASPLPVRAAAGKALTPVNIGAANVGLPLVLQRMIADLGTMADFGLEPKFLNVADANRLMGALIAGQIDICALSGFAPVPVAVEKGAKLKIVSGSTLLLNQCVFAKDPAIKTVKDLAGKTIGVGSLGSLLHQLMVAILKKKGVDLATVKFANVGSNQDVFRAVVAGVVDAGPSTIDVYNRQAEYGVHSLSDGEFWTELPEYTQQGSYTSDQAIATKRDALVAVLAAYAKLFRYLQGPDSKDAFVKARAAALGNSAKTSDSEFQWNWIQKYKPFGVDIALSDDRINYIQQLNVDFGAQKALLPIDKVADMSLARDAVKLLA
jgi:ABC-type nitrate/sulfonate/bicarbonate transport system substrate-binding protein